MDVQCGEHSGVKELDNNPKNWTIHHHSPEKRRGSKGKYIQLGGTLVFHMVLLGVCLCGIDGVLVWSSDSDGARSEEAE